jgi:transcriptional regulator with XRE-family HTH domain
MILNKVQNAEPCDLTTETFGQRIKRIRFERGLSLRDIEHQSGGEITSGYISLLENEKSCNPSVKSVYALAKGLDVPVSILQEVLYEDILPKSTDEQMMLILMRRLSDAARADLFEVARVFDKRHGRSVVRAGELSSNDFEHHQIHG